MRCKLIFFHLLLFSACTAVAQNVRLINSTEQSWSGGIAGRHGANYNFIVEFSGYRTEPVPDTVWIGKTPYPVITDNNNQYNVNTKRVAGKRGVQFSIAVGVARDDYAEQLPTPGNNEKKAPKPVPPVRYKGVALLSYKYRGEERYFEINKIFTRYPPVNYP